MKLLHTADWHWGAKSWRDSSRSIDRNPEIESALKELLDYAYLNKPDCILVGGDVFNYPTAPSESDAKKVLSLVIEFSKIAPVVLVLGNHDWKGLSTYDPFSSHIGIRMISKLSSSDDDKPIEDIEGLRIFCFPYFSIRNMLKIYNLEELQDKARESLVSYKNELKKLTKNDRWNVLLGHFAVDGVPYQNDYTITSELFVPKDFLSSELFDYVALGHIHSQRRVQGASAQSWYCGSLIRLGFGEEDNDVGALWVELSEGEGPKVKPIRLKSSKKLKTFLLDEFDLDRLKELLAGLDNEDCYVRVILKLSKGTIYSPVRCRSEILSLDERIVKVEIRKDEVEESLPIISRGKGLVEMFKEYLKVRGINNEVLVEKFKSYLEKVEKEDETHQDKD